MRELLKTLTEEQTQALSAEILRRLDGAGARDMWDDGEQGHSLSRLSVTAPSWREPKVKGGHSNSLEYHSAEQGRSLSRLPATVPSEREPKGGGGRPGGNKPQSANADSPFQKGPFKGDHPDSYGRRPSGGEGTEGGFPMQIYRADTRPAPTLDRGASMGEFSDFFQRDARRYDNGYEMY